jgi:hypothetical protein
VEQHASTSINKSVTEPEPPPSPRSFAIGTGVAFQTVGGVLVFAACLVWGFAAWTAKKSSTPLENWTDFFRGEHLPTALMTIALLVTLVGGASLLAVGVGLQGERPSSGRAAMVASGLMAVGYFVVAVTYVVAAGRILAALIVFALGLLVAVLFMIAGQSASVLRKFPPPSDLSAATPELLEEFRQKRLERLKHYEP